MNLFESDWFFEGSCCEFNIPNEDIWKKFEFLNTPPQSPSLSCPQEFSSAERIPRYELRHDCMWSGTCESDEHKSLLSANSCSLNCQPSSVDLPMSPNVSASDSDSELSCIDNNLVPHEDHSYGSPRRRPKVVHGLPTPSDSEEEPDPTRVKRSNVIDFSQLSEPIRQRLKLALSSIVKQKSTSHVIEVPTGNGNQLLEVRLHQSRKSLLDTRKVLMNRKPVHMSQRRKPPIHNSIERQRRVDLRLSFQNLRNVIPDLQHAKKAPKAAILDAAVKTCSVLKKKSEGLIQARKKENEKRDMLLKRLKVLQNMQRS